MLVTELVRTALGVADPEGDVVDVFEVVTLAVVLAVNVELPVAEGVLVLEMLGVEV